MEIFKPIMGYKDRYLVGNHGTILSQNYKRTGKTKQLIPRIANQYFSVHLSKFGSSKHHRVHRLVASAFISNPNKYSQVNHKDGDKFNNRYYNLEWCSPKQNMKHAMDRGLVNCGERHYAAKLSVYQVLEINSLINTMSYREIAKKYNVSIGAITGICTGKNWKHLFVDKRG